MSLLENTSYKEMGSVDVDDGTLKRFNHVLKSGLLNKNEESLRKTVVNQLLKTKAGRQKLGVLVLCGKGALGAEYARAFDQVLKTGIRFGMFEGLDIEQIEAGLFDVGDSEVDARSRIWDDGSRTLCRYAIHIWSAAARDLESKMRNYYCDKLIEHDEEMAFLQLKSHQDYLNGRESIYDKRIVDLQGKVQLITELLLSEPYRDSAQGLISIYQILRSGVHLTKGDEGTKTHYSKDLIKLFDFIGYQDENFSISDYEERLARGLIHPELARPGSLLTRAIGHYTNEFQKLGPEQQSSFTISLQNKFDQLAQGTKLVCSEGVPWMLHEKGDFHPEEVIRGESVTIDLNEAVHGAASTIVNSLVKQRVFRLIKSRGERPQWSKTETRVVCIIDEVHLICGLRDAEFFSICRSLGMMVFTGTQGVESLRKALGSNNAADLFLLQMTSDVAFNVSAETLQYIQKKYGKAKLTSSVFQVQGVDYSTSYDDLSYSIMNDVNHPNYANLREMRKYEVLMSQNSSADPLDKNPEKINYERVALAKKNSARVEHKEQEIVKQDQFAAYVGVGEPFVGLYRAGVKSIDYITVDFVQSKDIDDLSKPETVQYLKDCLTEFGGI
ncbi:TraM recognition domain-containing protein [Stenotrophomonas maltophilia]|uniref:TraM recognition domain-containing protein n=1 Tax=Stenotrophomonas maltophilia TaxID=40324 RepID=UPI000D1B6B3D